MRYEWGRHKALTNFRKHGIRFADAVAVFADNRALTVADPRAGEERYITVRIDAFARVLVVVYTWRGTSSIRLISAWRATRNERSQYTRADHG